MQKFELNKNSLKNTWKLIVTIKQETQRAHCTGKVTLQYGQTCTNKHNIGNQFNEYFINIGPNLASTIHSSIKPEAFLPANHSSSFFFLSPVNSAQIELAHSGFGRHKANIDIPHYLIKIASNLLSIPLTVFNNSVESRIVPDIFKISKVTPVFRASALTDPCNYHPIAVLSPVVKSLEGFKFTIS